MTTDIRLVVPWHTIPNLDADEPGSMPEITIGMRLGSRSRGLSPSRATPKLPILGLDLEVTTVERAPGMPLPEDEVMTIALTNGGWYDKVFADKCLCFHTFGKANSIE
jgi:DNA polymerase elongation subunit (family B)